MKIELGEWPVPGNDVDPAGAELAIMARGLVKRFDGFTAVDGVDISVPKGSIYGILGPNGAGKTTTMKMVCGLVRPTSGRVLVDGVDVVESPLEAKRALGYVPDRPSLYEKLTAFEYVRFVGGLYALPAADVDARGLTLLAQFGLGDKVNALVESFSHGMKQRLTLAGALLTRPRLLIVDEPMVGLDPRGARQIKQVFRDVAAEGRTVIVPDVAAFPGHIACDARSRSEIVVPVVDPEGAVQAVLDIDADTLAAFDRVDGERLERLVARFVAPNVNSTRA